MATPTVHELASAPFSFLLFYHRFAVCCCSQGVPLLSLGPLHSSHLAFFPPFTRSCHHCLGEASCDHAHLGHRYLQPSHSTLASSYHSALHVRTSFLFFQPSHWLEDRHLCLLCSLLYSWFLGLNVVKNEQINKWHLDMLKGRVISHRILIFYLISIS